MKARLLPPVLVLALVACGYVGFVWQTQHLLPDRVATHFDLHGQPNGWMTRIGFVKFTLAIGLGVPLVLVGAFSLVRIVPARFVSIPHADYWLAEERRTQSLTWLARLGLWFATVLLFFMAAVHYLILKANFLHPPRLDNTQLLAPLAALLACELVLVIRMIRHFRRLPAP